MKWDTGKRFSYPHMRFPVRENAYTELFANNQEFFR